MPVQAPGREILSQQIKEALLQVRNSGQDESVNSDDLITQFSTSLTDAIHLYVTSIIVTVNTTGTIIGTSPSGPVTGTATSTGSS